MKTIIVIGFASVPTLGFQNLYAPAFNQNPYLI